EPARRSDHALPPGVAVRPAGEMDCRLPVADRRKSGRRDGKPGVENLTNFAGEPWRDRDVKTCGDSSIQLGAGPGEQELDGRRVPPVARPLGEELRRAPPAPERDLQVADRARRVVRRDARGARRVEEAEGAPEEGAPAPPGRGGERAPEPLVARRS